MNTFQDLFIFEIANNHQGYVNHGVLIIKEMGKIAKKFNLNAGVKLQYRQLDTFIHPDFKKNKDAQHIGRFLSTELKSEEFLTLVKTIKSEGLLTICTPFDEQSVDLIEAHEIEVIKIASCSADDWPLISRIVKSNKPVIASTGGLDFSQMDNLVSYLTNRLKQVGVLHCVGMYPTPLENLNLNFIQKLKTRYPGVSIGYSGHESPENIDVIKLAHAKGASIFERHVGLPTQNIKLNAYSMNPDQVEKWIESYQSAKIILGNEIRNHTQNETDSLLSLKRGVFLKKAVKKGAFINESDVFYAMPCEAGQVTSGNFGKVRARYTASKDYKINDGLFENNSEDTYHKTRRIIHQAKALLAENNIVLAEKYSVELSHHYGIESFHKFGCIIVNLINREYCKKLIILFPEQHHPEQKHLKKEETFHVLQGDLNLSLNGITRKLLKGDIATVERGVLHSFYSDNGAVIEEISTTHFANDSFYTDPLITEQDPMQRKTYIERF
jgi:N-acetylneuraminate synthase